MQLEGLEKKVRRRPFKPFKVFLTDGTDYTIRHPEMVLLGRRSMVVGLAVDENQTVYDRSVDVDLFHIVRMEDVEAPASTNGPS